MLSQLVLIYMVTSGLVCRGLRLQIPEVLPTTHAGETSGICNMRPWPTHQPGRYHICIEDEFLC